MPEAGTRMELKGFTLLEVMIALLIFTIGAAGLIKGMSQIVTQHTRLEDKTFANWIAENRFHELRLAKTFPSPGEKKEDVEYASKEWVVVEKIIKTPNPFMRRVEISVQLLDAESNSTKQVHLTTGFIGNL